MHHATLLTSLAASLLLATTSALPVKAAARGHCDPVYRGATTHWSQHPRSRANSAYLVRKHSGQPVFGKPVRSHRGHRSYRSWREHDPASGVTIIYRSDWD